MAKKPPTTMKETLIDTIFDAVRPDKRYISAAKKQGFANKAEPATRITHSAAVAVRKVLAKEQLTDLRTIAQFTASHAGKRWNKLSQRIENQMIKEL